MRYWTLRQLLVAFVLAAGLALVGSPASADKDDEGFQDLFNGKDFTGWKTVLVGNTDPDKTWSIKEGVIICTGHPNGYFHTEKSHKNYVFRYDWRYKRPDGLKAEKDFKGNSGCLIHIQEPHKVWPKCVEVQGENLRHGILIFINNKKIESKYDQKTKDQVTHSVGEWNTTEIICKDDGSIIAKINGTEVSSGKGELTEGQIGFQSEGAEIHFRNIKIKELK